MNMNIYARHTHVCTFTIDFLILKSTERERERIEFESNREGTFNNNNNRCKQ